MTTLSNKKIYIYKKITNTEIDKFSNSFKIVGVGADDLHYLLKYSEAEKIGYNAGVCGWNYDAYIFNNYIILAGFRNIKSKYCVKDRFSIMAIDKVYDDMIHDDKFNNIYNNNLNNIHNIVSYETIAENRKNLANKMLLELLEKNNNK